ncbi:TonB-dependent receptor, partial [Bacteroidales bacterium OttesenSCG-928-M11]|nr:TonB-dependent receptor [Bacteroidales bacterium OttesenSCG-928-M11]
MNRYFFFLSLLFLSTMTVFADFNDNKYDDLAKQDTVRYYLLNDIIVSSSTKETNDLQTLPGSVSFITPSMIEGQSISTIKNISNIIPNLFIADYGSRLSTPMYIRGIGERSTGQSIGMYVDDMPLLNKSVFDFDLSDINRIEVLRGPQGTLYGRNAMSGIVNVFTNSPLDYQRTKIGISTGNYDLFKVKASTSGLLSENIGLSVNGYYNSHGGYFKFDSSDEKIDQLASGGGRIRLDWRISSNWTAQLMANYDYSDQGAFPYGNYDNGKISRPDHNYPGSYIRETASTNLNLRYHNEHIVFNSSTAFSHFNDNMKMDLDYSPMDMFYINQKQRQNAFTEELTIKSNTKNNYQWSFGIFGFYDNLKTDVTTTLGKDGIAEYIEKNIPAVAGISVADEKIPMPGLFKTPSYGGAIFHQSTYNNFLIENLSITAGVRLDYEKVELDYDTSAGMTLKSNRIPMPIPVDTLIKGKEHTDFTEIIPKFAVRYQISPSNYLYASVSNGYKTGGYNIQNFADITRDALMEAAMKTSGRPSGNKQSIDSLVSYKPEYSWNYELGFKGEVIKDFLSVEAALFYIQVKDMQITDFVESGQGRILKNSGKAESLGFELSLAARLTQELSLTTNYGFTQATFKDYKTTIEDENGDKTTVNYKGNHIPFAPQNTLSIGAIYNKPLYNKLIDRFHIQAYYNAAGRIYWTETNDVYQDFYGLLNLKTGISKGGFDLSIWVNNVLDTDYTAFYVESSLYNLAQAGKPINFGID